MWHQKVSVLALYSINTDLTQSTETLVFSVWITNTLSLEKTVLNSVLCLLSTSQTANFSNFHINSQIISDIPPPPLSLSPATILSCTQTWWPTWHSILLLRVSRKEPEMSKKVSTDEPVVSKSSPARCTKIFPTYLMQPSIPNNLSGSVTLALFACLKEEVAQQEEKKSLCFL